MKRFAGALAVGALVLAACTGGDGAPSTLGGTGSTTSSTSNPAASTGSGATGDAAAYCETFGRLASHTLETAAGVSQSRGELRELQANATAAVAAATETYAADFEAALVAIEAADYDLAAVTGLEFDTNATSVIGEFLNDNCTRLQLVTAAWTTDWDSRTIELDELEVGIGGIRDGRDAIPPIDDPAFETTDSALTWLDPREPGLLLEDESDARFYPLQIMTVHEVVNDLLGGVPVAVTYCPLCNSAVAFDRTVDGQTLRFGTSGLLRNADLVMWDDVTQSLWQQITGEAIVGELAGTRLEFVPTSIVQFEDFTVAFPDGMVLSRDASIPAARYGINAYEGYSSQALPGRPVDEIDERFPALERVVGVNVDDDARAYPFSVISEERTVNDELGGVPIVVLWGSEDTADALDTATIAEGASIGVGVAYQRDLEGQLLTFAAEGDAFVDTETGSTWDIFGRAVAGPLAGERLQPVIHRNEFWFAWTAFNGNDAYEGAG